MKVVTAVVNNPLFIQIQYYTLKKYMKCDYEFIVFNDAKDFKDITNGGDLTIKPLIEKTCKQFNIKCINIPNKHHGSTLLFKEPGFRTAESMNFILEYQKNPDCYLLLDSDMFLIDYFDHDDYKKYECSVVLQKRKNLDHTDIHYIWNGLYYFDTYKLNQTNDLSLMNWHCAPTTDTGGMMSTWLNTKINNYPQIEEIKTNRTLLEINNVYFIKYLCSLEWTISDLPESIKNEKLVIFLTNDPRNQKSYFVKYMTINFFIIVLEVTGKREI